MEANARIYHPWFTQIPYMQANDALNVLQDAEDMLLIILSDV